jgi:FOG: Ankyrin repeat
MSKKVFLKDFEVTNPCGEDWEKMRGDDRVRFCSHCNLNVNNLSAMTHKEALKLIRESEGRLCVRYVKNPKTNAPVFADKLYQIARRARIAAGILGASLSLSVLSYAQGGIARVNLSEEPQKSSLKKSFKDETESAPGKVSGVIRDSAGAVIPNATVTITNLKTGWNATGTSDENGFYQFESVPQGAYKIQASFAGFENAVRKISVTAGKEVVTEISLETGEQFVTVGAVAFVEFINPLHRAVSENDLEQVKNLIAQGAKINAKDENYSDITPLFLAVENGDAKMTQMLLSYGAKVNARDLQKRTPLMRLDHDATPKLVEILIKHGAKINMKDEEGNTALMWAVSNEAKPEVIRFLLLHGANIDEQNDEGDTALMKAAYGDNLEAVRVLLEAGANVNLKNKEGETALDMTTDEEIEKLLEYYGAISGKDSDEEEN